MNKIIQLFILFFILVNCETLQANENKVMFNYKNVSLLPILVNGRVKPLDTFARNKLSIFHNKDSLNSLTAAEWLVEAIFSPEKNNTRRFFRIVNNETISTLKLIPDSSNNYSPVELIQSFQSNIDLVEEISKTESLLQTPAQKQILELYQNLQSYIEISRSLSFYLKEFSIHQSKVANVMQLPFNEKISYNEIMLQESFLKKHLTEMIKNKRLKNPNEVDNGIIEIINYIDFIRSDRASLELKIIPNGNSSNWSSPWEFYNKKSSDKKSIEYLNTWKELYKSFLNSDSKNFEINSKKLYTIAGYYSNQTKLAAEVTLNQLNLFINSIVLYLLSFILFFTSFLFYKRQSLFLSRASLFSGFIMHSTGIILRCYIMNRPPVTSLYESILFVGFVAVFASIIFEQKVRNGNGLFIGSTLGSLLLLVSIGYEKDGDTLGMLVAVLDTNFWLATHVVTISIGYGCSLVAALLAHLYLFKKYFTKDQDSLKPLLNNIHNTVLFSLFFTILGTILGGIWADQSWGRFWGWDPKENGALFLCLWLLFIIHGKLAGYFKENTYPFFVALTSIIVILAWFGVNLLNVGLHSYGFTDSIAKNIIIFASSEFLILIIFYIRKKK